MYWSHHEAFGHGPKAPGCGTESRDWFSTTVSFTAFYSLTLGDMSTLVGKVFPFILWYIEPWTDSLLNTQTNRVNEDSWILHLTMDHEPDGIFPWRRCSCAYDTPVPCFLCSEPQVRWCFLILKSELHLPSRDQPKSKTIKEALIFCPKNILVSFQI